MSDIFRYDEYTINTIYTELFIYIKIIDNTTYKCYESVSEIENKNKTYEIMKNSFNQIENYDLYFVFENNKLTLVFNAPFDNIIESVITIILYEKKLSELELLSIKIDNIDYQYKKEINTLKRNYEQKIEYLESIILNKN